MDTSTNKIIKDIPLELIEPNPDNETIYTLNDIDLLMENIKDLGFIGSIEVYELPNGKYQILSGHRRYEAMKRLGKLTIPCSITALEDEISVRKKLISSNLNTRVLSPIEQARQIIYYEDTLILEGFRGDKSKEISRFMGISSGKVSALKSLLEMTDGIKELAQLQNFPYTAFGNARYFSKDQQNSLVKYIKTFLQTNPPSELNTIIVNQFINDIKNNTKKQKALKQKEQMKNELREEITNEIVHKFSHASDNSPAKIENKDGFLVIESNYPSINLKSINSNPNVNKSSALFHIQLEHLSDSMLDMEIKNCLDQLTILLNNPNNMLSDKIIKYNILQDLKELIALLENR